MSGQMKRMTFKSSGAVIAAATTTTTWIDVSAFNEGYFWLNVTVFASRVDETLDVTIERKTLGTTGYTTVATFTQIATAAAAEEEKTLIAATGLLGGKIRARYVTAGTWTSKSITFAIEGEVKRV